MQEPEQAIARALGGRTWTTIVLSAAALGMTASFAALVDSGWSVTQALLGGVIAACLLVLAGILLEQQRQQRRAGRDAP